MGVSKKTMQLLIPKKKLTTTKCRGVQKDFSKLRRIKNLKIKFKNYIYIYIYAMHGKNMYR